MKITIDVSAKTIADAMTGAIECNSMTTAWCLGVYLVKPYNITLQEPWYSDPKLYDGRRFTLKVVELFDEVSEGTRDILLSQRAFADGLALMAQRQPVHFADLVSESGTRADSITYDVFLQMVALGEVRYG